MEKDSDKPLQVHYRILITARCCKSVLTSEVAAQVHLGAWQLTSGGEDLPGELGWMRRLSVLAFVKFHGPLLVFDSGNVLGSASIRSE